MQRMPPPDGHHAPAHAVYEHAWRPPYPPSYDSHAQESRRSSTTSQTPLPSAYPVIPNRELPHLPPDSRFVRPSSLPSLPPHAIPESNPPHANYRPPINGTPHGTPHETSPHTASPDYRPRIGYQPPDQQPSPGESTPVSGLPPSQFMSPVPPMPPGAPPHYDPGYYQNPAYGAARNNNQQRKAARATQACDQCRARKAKCDEGRPACSHCKENSLNCVYKEVPPHKQEKTTQLLLDRMLEMEDRIIGNFTSMQTIVAGHGQQLEMLHQAVNRPGSSVPAPAPEPALKAESQALSQGIPQIEAPDEKGAFPTPIHSQVQASGQLADPMVGSLDDPLKNDNEGELSIPVEHTTAAHKLLMWPSIKRLLDPKQYDEDYVMRLEEERGLISVYGQGEISYTADDTRLPSPSSAPEGVGAGPGWDDRRTNGDGSFKDRSGSVSEDANAEITRSGFLRLHPDTARRYYRSYLDRMHKLHPFLSQNELDSKIQVFIRLYCPDDPSSLCRDNPRGAKRKRSSDDLEGFRGASTEATGSAQCRVGRNIDNAIILLIFALGAICETKSPLPGPIMDDRMDYLKQHIPGPLPPLQAGRTNGATANGLHSPANSDSALPTSASYYTSHITNVSQSFPPLDRFHLSATQDNFGNSKNLQVIPGLSLYGFATVILGHLQGGVELEHVQAGLLAGLYAGQLAHPFQSHGWICQAARACQVLVRQRRYERLEEGVTQDLYNFAYWTCLQLESDLLAELDIPASGISRSEGRMGLPKGRYTITLPDDLSAPNTMMMLFYSAQIHLRKVLNRVHTDLYKVEKQGQTRWSSNVQEALSMNLNLWRNSLPDIMGWNDKDPPASDINAARMRAKYYGARYIIHRPLLYHALHYGQTGARVGSVGQTSVDSPTGSTSAAASQTQHMSPSMTHTNYRATGMSRIVSDYGSTPSNGTTTFAGGWTPPKASLRDLPSKLRRACAVCIESAILSTQAFDGIEDRLVVTNIFGTAHAQFGNMLVLAATYNSSLHELVERSTLERLLRRTIKFLLRSRHISPTLRADARILTEIYEKIFEKMPELE
ncbi:hypothetical protein N7512_005772 [Penicillium capsulatum]|nr:hypothetical protein N7512_005772 [Penicillium capsulatum]